MNNFSGITDLLKRYGAVTTVTRPGPTARVQGQAQPVGALDKTFQVMASIQPFTPRDILRLPEGDRVRRWFWVFSDTALQAVTPPTQKGDRLPYPDGSTLEIQGPADFVQSAQVSSVNHFVYKAAAVNTQ